MEHSAMTTSEGWLVPLLLVSMLEGNFYGSQLKSRVEELGFDLPRQGTMYRALHTMEREGLVISNRDGSEDLLSRWRFEPTEAGEAYLEFWAHSLAQYREEIERFFSVYEGLDGFGPHHGAFETLGRTNGH